MPIDYKKYPPNWKSEIVPRILKRADNKCEVCGVDNYAELWSVPIKVHVNGRYKVKRIWITNDSDLVRIKDIACGDIKKITVVLTVAHLDHDEENHNVQDGRLKAMCQFDHINYDCKEKHNRLIRKKGESNLLQGNTNHRIRKCIETVS